MGEDTRLSAARSRKDEQRSRFMFYRGALLRVEWKKDGGHEMLMCSKCTL